MSFDLSYNSIPVVNDYGFNSYWTCPDWEEFTKNLIAAYGQKQAKYKIEHYFADMSQGTAATAWFDNCNSLNKLFADNGINVKAGGLWTTVTGYWDTLSFTVKTGLLIAAGVGVVAFLYPAQARTERLRKGETPVPIPRLLAGAGAGLAAAYFIGNNLTGLTREGDLSVVDGVNLYDTKDIYDSAIQYLQKAVDDPGTASNTANSFLQFANSRLGTNIDFNSFYIRIFPAIADFWSLQTVGAAEYANNGQPVAWWNIWKRYVNYH
jgi:hypothetical protein